MAKILVVDDSEVQRAELKQDLEAREHEVILGADGLEGVKRAEEFSDIDLIISDYNMPGMDGIEMCQKIRSISAHGQTPILMLTTESTPQLMAQGKQVGVLAWVVKPYEGNDLIQVIQQILGN